MSMYAHTLQGWSYVDVTLSEAVVLISRLVEKGAGFCHTSEPSIGRRIYFTSRTSTEIVEEFARERERAASASQ